MTKKHKDRPRQQYYEFIHHALPVIFFQNPEKLISSIKKDGTLFLKYIWDKLGEYSQQEKDVDFHLDHEIEESEQYKLIKLIMPFPEHDHEAFAVALSHKKNSPASGRYFVFENRLIDGRQQYIIGEWVEENYIEIIKLNSADISLFYKKIKSII
jgi:hypothetical protein